MVIERSSPLLEPSMCLRNVGRRAVPNDLEAFGDLGHDLFAGGFGTMKVKSKVAQSENLKSMQYNLESCSFLSDEEHAFAIGGKRCDQVRDGLAFPGSRWTLNDAILFALNALDHSLLTGVCVQYQEFLVSWHLVEVMRIEVANRIQHQIACTLVTGDSSDEVVRCQSVCVISKVPDHRHFLEREVAKDNATGNGEAWNGCGCIRQTVENGFGIQARVVCVCLVHRKDRLRCNRGS
jgi:hypothetical protein